MLKCDALNIVTVLDYFGGSFQKLSTLLSIG